MADEADKANDIIEEVLRHSLAYRMPTGPAPIGACHNCGEPFEDPERRWCDADCRSDWEDRR